MMNNHRKTLCEEAAQGLRNAGCFAFTNAGKVYVDTHTEGEDEVWVEVSEDTINSYALACRMREEEERRQEEQEIEAFRESDPFEVLENVARIFHYLGWDLGENGSHDTSFIEDSEAYLELVYKAFNPIHKK